MAAARAGEKRRHPPASPEGGTALQSLQPGPDPGPRASGLSAQVASQGRLGASLSRGGSVIPRSGPPTVCGVQPALSPLPALSLTRCAPPLVTRPRHSPPWNGAPQRLPVTRGPRRPQAAFWLEGPQIAPGLWPLRLLPRPRSSRHPQRDTSLPCAPSATLPSSLDGVVTCELIILSSAIFFPNLH